MDCNYSWEEAVQAHPEWFERDRDGQPRRHNESTWLFKTCMFSPYFIEQMPAIYREIGKRYAVDSFFTNGWPSTGALGVCYCESCQKISREKVGGVPPEQTDATSPLYRRYYAAFMDRLLEVWRPRDAAGRERRTATGHGGRPRGGIRVGKEFPRHGPGGRRVHPYH